jgi:hypothetical protein
MMRHERRSLVDTVIDAALRQVNALTVFEGDEPRESQRCNRTIL